MGFKEIISGIGREKEERKTFERGQRIVERHEQKKLSSNERELINHLEREHQANVRKELEIVHQIDQKKFVQGYGMSPNKIPNVLKDNRQLFRGRAF